jgi:cytosine/adenosine deaminase-related metal-dependent hydrolase
MLVAADWVVPVTGRPIRKGAVLTHGGRIAAVGTLADLRASAADESVEQFDGCAIVPGLVNAHTHVSLTVLGGLVEPMAASPSLQRLTTAVLAMGNDELAASSTLGALECLRHGITAVGDIGYGPEPLAACADAGVGGVFYWEVKGIDAHDLSGELAEMEFPSEVGACSTGRTRCGISPHSVYASGPSLIKAAWQVSQRHHTGFAMHVAESPAERDLMLSGTGPLAEVARKLARGFAAPRMGSVAYLADLGVLKDAVAIHCTNLEHGDAARLKGSVRGVVVCPRATARLHNGEPPAQDLWASGVRVAIGTDSLASNTDYDLFAEARALRDLDASLTSRRLLSMMTVDGAKALGIDDVCGSLTPGHSADVTVVRTGPTEDPESAVLRCGSRDTVHAVIGSGIWRVRDGKIALPTMAAERAAERARGVVRRALERSV